MSVYTNHCGKFEIDIWEGGPMWVKLKIDGHDAQGHVHTGDLYDLQYLIGRAIDAAEAQEAKFSRAQHL